MTLVWDNGAGLIFRRTIALDDNYMFTVTQSVENATGAEVRLAPYGIIARHGRPANLRGFYILHEGVIGAVDGILEQITWNGLEDLPADPAEAAQAEVIPVAENGWIGFTDHYWMSTLVAEPGQPFTAVLKHNPVSDTYQTDMRLPVMAVAPGASAEVSTWLFAGAKEWATIRDYQRDLGIDRFVDAIDWGWFWFLTKPIFMALHYLNLLDRQHGRGDHLPDGDHQGAAVPARLQVLRLDVQDEGAPARDGGDQGAQRRRPHEDAAGGHGPLQEGEGQPGRRLPADPAADPDLLLALQGDLRHARAAPCAVLRLDQGPVGARPDLDPEPVRPVALGGARAGLASCSSSRSASGRS